MFASSSRAALAVLGLAAAVALAIAFAAEWWGGLVPCALCLVERWPYRIAVAVAVLGMVLPRFVARVALVLVLLIALAEVAAAGMHVGVELGFWPSPLPECAAPNLGQGSIAERLRNMPARPAKPCDEGVFPIEALPLSFAELNFLYALALTGASFVAVTRRHART